MTGKYQATRSLRKRPDVTMLYRASRITCMSEVHGPLFTGGLKLGWGGKFLESCFMDSVDWLGSLIR